MNTPNQRATKCSMQATKAYCCYIGCDKSATKLIYAPNGTYEEYTHSCDDHIEDLKSDTENVVEPIGIQI